METWKKILRVAYFVIMVLCIFFIAIPAYASGRLFLGTIGGILSGVCLVMVIVGPDCCDK